MCFFILYIHNFSRIINFYLWKNLRTVIYEGIQNEVSRDICPDHKNIHCCDYIYVNEYNRNENKLEILF